MRKYVATILLTFFAASAGPAHAESYYALMKEGVTHYQTGELEKAQETFSSTVAVATNKTEHLTLAQYNLANTEHRLGNFQGATELYGDALNHEDPIFRADAFYNRGLSLFELSKATEEAEQLDEAIMQVSTAMGMFEQSLELNAEARDAKTNLEIAYLRHEALLKKKEEQEQQEQEENQDENEDSENQDEEKKEDEEKKDEEKQGDEKQDEQNSENQDEENQDEQNPENQDEQNQDQEQPNEPEPSEDEQQNPDQNGDPDQQDPSEAEQGEPGEEQKMTPEEADMLLDALREKEKADRARFRMRYGSPPNYPVEKPY